MEAVLQASSRISATLLKIGRCFMDFKERYEFCKKIESYAQMVAACLAEQMKVEQQIACERVLEHLGIVIEMMLDETPPQDMAVILVPDPRHDAVAASAIPAALDSIASALCACGEV